MNEHKKLFDQFTPVSREDWNKQVAAESKGADLGETLSWKITDDFSIDALYDLSNQPEVAYLQNYQPFDPAETGSRQWRNRQEIAVNDLKQANHKALEALNKGADEIAFEIPTGQNTEIDLNVLLHEILLNYCAVSFVLHGETGAFIKKYLAYAAHTGVDLHTLTGSVVVRGTELSVAELQLLVKMTVQAPGLRVLVLSSELSADPVQQLASLLLNAKNILHGLLNHGISISEIVRQMEFSVETGNHYFVEIAKLRALRFLVAQMIRYYGLADYKASSVFIHARTTLRAYEAGNQDLYSNMLSNTTQAMSAIIGGCNVLTVIPHNAGAELPDNLSERVARNVSNILKEESYLDKIADPAAGSFYIDQLTHRLAEAAWEKFRTTV